MAKHTEDMIMLVPGQPSVQLSPKQREHVLRRTADSISSVNLSDQHHYIEPLATTGSTALSLSAAQRRFVAGTAFFNYDDFGSLRLGQEPIELFSSGYIGLAIHVMLCGFSFYFFSNGYGRLLAEYLKANDENQVQAASYLLVWPQALSLFIGLISDCFPICGYRRKSYMIIGWAISLVAYAALIVMDLYGHSGQQLYQSTEKDTLDSVGSTSLRDETVNRFAVPYLVVSLVAAIGIETSWVAALAVSVEYAQREHLHYRGRLQATLLGFYYLGGVAAQAATASIIAEGVNEDHLSSSISVGTAASILAIVSGIAVPIVVFFFNEERFLNTSRVGISVGQRLRDFWRFTHQNVVYRVLFFIILHMFFIGLFNQNVRDAVQKWSRVSAKDALQVDVARMVSMLVAVMVWNEFLRNMSWRRLSFWGSTLYISLHITQTLCATLDIVRSEWVYGALASAADVPRAWLLLYAIILATEIADVGLEGVTVALGISYRTLAALIDYTLGAVFPKVIGYEVTMQQVEEDSAETRSNVVTAFMIVLALNLLSYPVILALPRQRLDAQQLRAFGGYNRFASTGLVVIFVILLCVNLAANVVIVL